MNKLKIFQLDNILYYVSELLLEEVINSLLLGENGHLTLMLNADYAYDLLTQERLKGKYYD
jgi:hypothetical protein